MSKQHVYGSPVTVTQNTARVESIIYRPQEGIIQVEYAIGEVSGSQFTKTDSEFATVRFNQLNGTLQTTFNELEDRALQYGANNVFPSGSIQDI